MKSIGEARVDTFRKRYSFPPPNVQVSFPLSRSRFATCMEEDRGRMNFIYWKEVHISKRLRFPLPLLVYQFFHHTCLHLVHTHVNNMHIFLGVCVLNRRHSTGLGLEEVIDAYTIKRYNLEKYYLVVDAKLF